MRKRNSLNYEITKSLFDASADDGAGGSYFKVNGGNEPVIIPIPVSIMHRLYRLGQAYGIRQLRYLEPRVHILVGTVEIPEFVSDLRRLVALVNDEVLHEYLQKLLSAIEAHPGPGSKSVAAVTPDYLAKRP